MNEAKIINDVKEVLDNNYITYTDSVVETYIDKWHIEKAGIITLLRKHPNWNEEAMAVCFDKDVKRGIGREKYHMYLGSVVDWCSKTPKYQYGDPGERTNIIRNLNRIYDCLSPMQFADEDWVSVFKEMGIQCNSGQKVSRILNKYFTSFFRDKTGEISDDLRSAYNSLFAQLSDAVNPITVKRHTLLSVHPCDFLLMSNGNSWDSCQRLGGGWRAGTLSYMTDKCSMIFYTVVPEYDGNQFWEQPKINRQIYGYHRGTLIQSRLYPDYSDEDLTKQFKTLVQQIIAECLYIKYEAGVWKEGGTAKEYCKTAIGALHYKDYDRDKFNCTTSFIGDGVRKFKVQFGNEVFCLRCGKKHDDKRMFSHNFCRAC